MSSREFYSLSSDGRWTAPNRAALGSVIVPVDPTDPTPTDPNVDPTPPTSRDLPDVPTVTWQSLYVAGDTLMQTLTRLTQPAAIIMPSDQFLFEFSDFTAVNNSFGFWRSPLLGMIGQGSGSTSGTRFRIKKNSSTQVARVPAQGNGASNPLTFARIDGNAANFPRTVMANLSMVGTDQPPSSNNENKPHNYSGLLNYTGRGSVYQNLYIAGMPGNWSNPPGETFALNDYKGIGTIYRDIEVDGNNPETGERVGGSPLGFNNTVNGYIEDCYFHDSRVSSLTFAYTGTSFAEATMTKNVETHRVKIYANANHVDGTGKGFSCINHEGAAGYVKHYWSDLSLGTAPGDPAMLWDDAHVTMYSGTLNADFLIDHVKWAGGSTLYGGAFIVKMPKTYAGTDNKQVTPPVVTDRLGRKLSPIYVESFPRTPVPIDITKQYILLNA